MGLFGDLDVASAADDPFKVPPGTYGATLSKIDVGPTKNNPAKIGMWMNYTITDAGEGEGLVVSEWKEIVQPVDPKNLTSEESRSASFLKQRLLSLGIPQDRMNTVEADDLIGIDVVITVVENKGYSNISKLALAADSGFDSDNPFE